MIAKRIVQKTDRMSLTSMASRFSFYSFLGYEFLISRIQLLISTIKFFDIKNLIVDINNSIFTSEMSP